MGRLQAYLEGPEGQRCLGTDFINIERENGPDGIAWGRQMESTRRLSGNDVAVNGRGPVTFKHYVLSPDPRDGCDLETLRDLALEWARENFGDYEVAIAYHDDNENHIPHAHVIVNNTNLVTGRRISGEHTNERVRGINNSLQNLALKLGLSAFSEDHRSMNEEEMSASGANASRLGDERGRREWVDHRGRNDGNPRRMPRPPRTRGPRADLAERGIESRGEGSWVAEVRDAVDLARRISRSEAELLSALAAMGVGVGESRGGDWIFRHPSGGAKRVRGARLGQEFSRNALEGEMRAGVAAGLAPGARRTLGQRRAVIAAMGARRAGRKPPSARQVVGLLDYNARNGVTSYDGYGRDKTAQRMLRMARAISLFDADPKGPARRAAGASRLAGDPRRAGAPARRLAGPGGYEPQGQVRRDAGARGDDGRAR